MLQPVYSNRRMVMRSTWLNKQMFRQQIGRNIKIVFFVGMPNNTSDQQRLTYESELYKDIVETNYEDSYIHNTYKAMAYLQ